MNNFIKNIFINNEIEYLRSGWRIGIYLIISAACLSSITPLVPYFKQITILTPQVVGMFFTYALLTVATWIMVRFVDKRLFNSVGLTFKAKAGKELFQGLFLGSGMMSVIFIIEYATGMVYIEFRDITMQESVAIFANSILLYGIVGYGEEFLFRGYLFQTFVEGSNKIIATLTLSLIFAIAHSKNPNVSTFGLINVGLAGIWLSIAYFKTKALWLPIGLHISWNFFQGFVYSYPVSGTTSEKEQIGKAIVSGPDWITGGTFGPEGGALATLMLIIGTLIIVKWNWITSVDGLWNYEQWKEERKQKLNSQITDTIQQIP